MSSKRRHYDNEPESKKVRPELEQAAYSTSDEWPIYNHPEGGVVKITPWGSLRQYLHPISGQPVTKFEDMSFQDHSFNQAASEQQYVPSTPQSMCPQSSDTPSPDGMRFGSEAEQYVVDGYTQPTPLQNSQEEFHQEHENYFGMGQQEEETDQENTSSDQMMM